MKIYTKDEVAHSSIVQPLKNWITFYISWIVHEKSKRLHNWWKLEIYIYTMDENFRGTLFKFSHYMCQRDYIVLGSYVKYH